MRNIKSIRAELNLSQEEMAKKMGLPLGTYVAKEQGRSPLLARELRKLSLISKVPEEEIEIPC